MHKKAGFLLSFTAGALLVILGFVCLCSRAMSFAYTEKSAVLAAALFSMPDGLSTAVSLENDTQSMTDSIRNQNDSGTVHLWSTGDEQVYSEDYHIYDDVTHYPVVETNYSGGDVGYNDFFIKNSTGFNLDVKKYLEASLGFDFDNNSEAVQVLIVHTHTSESYLAYDAGFFHEGFYPRSSDSERNMLRVGEAITQSLRENGIGVVHATEVHDDPKYDGAYGRSRATIEKYLEMYPEIKVVLDIHRDSISYGTDGGKIKPTFTVDGRKAAQIMIMSGYDPDGYYDFDFWEENLSFALKLQDTAENMYPGMTRPLYFGNFAYNMNINNGSLLIEVGTDVNTLEEAVYSGKLLGNVLAKVLQSS